ncbi:hypothetical protein VNI00_017542 [Paramarasmius palmivorus]|uniref:Uncharacterized protein n=1 Tax=Paramarasmius palmivorus TaxID=297713 RepID=A0AAW0B4W6_9AGAR
MDLPIEEAKAWERSGLTLLSYNLYVAHETWPEWLEVLHEHANDTGCHDHIRVALDVIFQTAKEEYKRSLQEEDVDVPSPAPSPPLPQTLSSPPQTPPTFAIKVSATAGRRPQTPYPVRSEFESDEDDAMDISDTEYDGSSDTLLEELNTLSAPEQLLEFKSSLLALPILQPQPVYAYRQEKLEMLVAVA